MAACIYPSLDFTVHFWLDVLHPLALMQVHCYTMSTHSEEFCCFLFTLEYKVKVDVFQPAHLIIQPIKLSLNVQFDWLVGVTIRLKAEWKCTSMEPGEECVDTVATGI